MSANSFLLSWQGLVEGNLTRVEEVEFLKKYQVSMYHTFAKDGGLRNKQFVSITNHIFMSCDCQDNSLISCVHTRATDQAIEEWIKSDIYTNRKQVQEEPKPPKTRFGNIEL